MFNQGRLPGYGQGRPPRYGQGRPSRYDRRMYPNSDFNEESDSDDFSNGETLRPSASQQEIDQQQQQQQQQQQPSYSGGYTVISPDEKKRRKLLEQAERERQMYEQHRRQNTPTHLSYVGPVGREYGLTQSEARQQQIQTHAQHNKTSRLLKEAERRNKQREAEEKVLEEKKMTTRKQAEKNAQREQERRELWRDDMRRTNQAFLNKLESQSKPAATAKPPPPSNPQPTVRQQPSSPSSNPAGGHQQNRPRELYTSSRKEAAFSTLAGQRNSSRDSPPGSGDVRKSTKGTAHQPLPISFFPPARTEVASNLTKLQPKSTRGARDARNGELPFNTTGHQKKPLQGSETAPGKGEASSKNSGGFGSLYSSSARSRMAMPPQSRAEGSTFNASKFENSTSPAMTNSSGVSSLGGRNSGSSYARGPRSKNSLFAGGLDEVSSSRSSRLDEGSLQGSLAGGYRSWTWHVGGDESGGSGRDRNSSERSDIEEQTSEGSYRDEHGFDDSYSSEQRSDGVRAGEYGSEKSYGEGRSFKDLKSSRERPDSLHPLEFPSATSYAEEFPYASDMTMDVDGPAESGFDHGHRNSMEFSASGEKGRSKSWLRTQDRARADEKFEDDLSAEEEEEEEEEDRLASESAPENSADVWEKFQTLQKRFPHFDQSVLWDILQQCDGSVEQALQLLAL